MGALYSILFRTPTPPPLKHRPTSWSAFEQEIASDIVELLPPTAAGVFCTDGTYVLAGYQPHKQRPCISGIGGHCEPGDHADTAATAFREMMEELFGITAFGTLSFQAILGYTPKHVRTRTYVNYTVTFDELERVLAHLARTGAQSPYYAPSFPTTVRELVDRRSVPVDAELHTLYMLHMETFERDGIDVHLINDIATAVGSKTVHH